MVLKAIFIRPNGLESLCRIASSLWITIYIYISSFLFLLLCCMFIDLITKTYISRLAHKSRSSVNHETESFWRLFLQAATADVDVDVTFCCRLGAAYRIFIFICISISISTSICISSRNIVGSFGLPRIPPLLFIGVAACLLLHQCHLIISSRSRSRLAADGDRRVCQTRLRCHPRPRRRTAGWCCPGHYASSSRT